MNRSNILHTSRRGFAAKVASGCAVCCLGPQRLLATSESDEEPLAQQDKHKFEEEQTRTYRRTTQMMYRPLIAILEQVEKDIGKEELLTMLKRASHAGAVQMGKTLTNEDASAQAFKREYSRQNVRTRFKSGEDVGMIAAWEAANGKSWIRMSERGQAGAI